ncbi:restriction endonuclease [Clostridium perfringens]|uniref:restriction endonuclease n=1 Tax=Clostridium perfringens TaxID=1502 RepID=UPI002247F498|nr:restriction endonuclease [Clostridium perfringens]MCX0405463.1 restriction endonuclease [Clostridium perfringens]
MIKGVNAAEIYNSEKSEEQILEDLIVTDEQKEYINKKILDIKEDNYGQNNFERGKALEELMTYILEATNIFQCIDNKHTSSNEFDILVKLNFHGRNLRAKKIIPEWIPDKFLIECKNMSDPVKVGLLGKFYSLIKQSKITLGIFVTKNSISGKYQKKDKDSKERYWKDANAFINKINLKYSESSNPINLLDLELKDIELITKKCTSILELIEIRKDQIELDVNSDLDEWIGVHENENKF